MSEAAPFVIGTAEVLGGLVLILFRRPLSYRMSSMQRGLFGRAGKKINPTPMVTALVGSFCICLGLWILVGTLTGVIA